MKTYEKEKKLIPSPKSNEKNTYDKIHKSILKKKKIRVLEREELMRKLHPSTSSNKLKNNINSFIQKCRIGYYSMLDV